MLLSCPSLEWICERMWVQKSSTAERLRRSKLCANRWHFVETFQLNTIFLLDIGRAQKTLLCKRIWEYKKSLRPLRSLCQMDLRPFHPFQIRGHPGRAVFDDYPEWESCPTWLGLLQMVSVPEGWGPPIKASKVAWRASDSNCPSWEGRQHGGREKI